MDLRKLAQMSDDMNYSISPENFTGERGNAAAAADGTGAYPARELGKGWKISPSIMIKSGEVFCLADIEGSGAITNMWFGGVVCKNYILRIYWDNEKEPSVECPLSDFFAYGWGEATTGNWMKGPFCILNSLPVAVAPNRGFNCFWYMPFRKHCLMTIENRTENDFMCYYQINYVKKKIAPEELYFHAQYRQAVPLRRKEDFVILDNVRGRGQYVGTALSIGLNGDGKWWGEGEVKVAIDEDNEQSPETCSICFTGTEDYFGGSFNWEVEGEYVTYSTPYMGMFYYQKPDGLYHIQPRFSMYRWHIADPINFRKSIKVSIQDLGWKKENLYLARRDDFYSVAYWYQELEKASYPKLPDSSEMVI